MTPQRMRPPEGGPVNALAGGHHRAGFNTMKNAAARALAGELAIIVAAADRLAGGYGLAWDDLKRVHEAHQFTIRVLAEIRGREVLQ